MTEFSRMEVYNSYLFLRQLLGLTNKQKDDSFLIGIRYTGHQILALIENSIKSVLLLEYAPRTRMWYFVGNYSELEPVGIHIKKAIEKSTNSFLSEPAYDALKEIIAYKL